MGVLTAVKALSIGDLKNVRRDPLLAFLAVFALALALVMRWGIPALTLTLQRRFEFDLVPYYPLILSFVALTMPTLAGTIIGFLLLDQRDDGTLSALRVTPLTLRGYMVYRAAAPIAVSILLTAVAVPLTGLMRGGLGSLLVYSVVTAPLGLIFALFLAAFAANKVQGFALMKASGVFTWPALLAWFVPMPWQLALGFVPHYWLVKIIWLEEAGQRSWPYALVAVAFQLVLMLLLARRFERVA